MFVGPASSEPAYNSPHSQHPGQQMGQYHSQHLGQHMGQLQGQHPGQHPGQHLSPFGHGIQDLRKEKHQEPPASSAYNRAAVIPTFRGRPADKEDAPQDLSKPHGYRGYPKEMESRGGPGDMRRHADDVQRSQPVAPPPAHSQRPVSHIQDLSGRSMEGHKSPSTFTHDRQNSPALRRMSPSTSPYATIDPYRGQQQRPGIPPPPPLINKGQSPKPSKSPPTSSSHMGMHPSTGSIMHGTAGSITRGIPLGGGSITQGTSAVAVPGGQQPRSQQMEAPRGAGPGSITSGTPVGREMAGAGRHIPGDPRMMDPRMLERMSFEQQRIVMEGLRQGGIPYPYQPGMPYPYQQPSADQSSSSKQTIMSDFLTAKHMNQRQLTGQEGAMTQRQLPGQEGAREPQLSPRGKDPSAGRQHPGKFRFFIAINVLHVL